MTNVGSRRAKALAAMMIAACTIALTGPALAGAAGEPEQRLGKVDPQAARIATGQTSALGGVAVPDGMFAPGGPAAPGGEASGGEAAARQSAAARQEVCPGRYVPALKSAQVEPEYTSAFAHYGNTGGGWTGGDSTYTVQLPGGRTLWLFSDTFLGKVNPDGTRPEGEPIVNSTFVEERGGRFRTIHGGTADNPAGILPPPADNAWYWLGAGHFGAGTLQVAFQRYDRFGEGQWDWGFTGTVLARFNPVDYSLIDITELPDDHKIAWGSWIQKHGPFTYIYGIEDHGFVKYMHVARVLGADLRGPWQFHTAGDGWSLAESDSARVMENVANEYSVTRFNGMFMLITQDTGLPFSTEIVAYFSCSLTGPFVGRTALFHTPETGGNIFTYNAHEHPDLRTADDRLLITYNVNSFAWEDHFLDASIYRPRFMEVRFE